MYFIGENTVFLSYQRYYRQGPRLGLIRQGGAMLICFVSLKGVRLQSSFPVDSGEVLNITRALGDNLITFKGKAIYVTPSEGQGFELGISIEDIENQDRIALAQAGAFWARFSILPG